MPNSSSSSSRTRSGEWRRALAARGKAVSVAELQHFFYGQFRHTIEYRLLKLAMRVEEDLLAAKQLPPSLYPPRYPKHRIPAPLTTQEHGDV